MAKQELEVTAHSTAEPSTVYALLRDGSTWPVWSGIERFVLERPGSPEPESVGAIRNFHRGRYKMRERIAELVPDKRFSYTLLSGLALKDYRADVDLTPAGDGTDIRWHTSFRPKVPGMGWIYRRALLKYTEEFANSLAEYAGKQ
ncbi:SRPBCC family protein [Kibdelosporangium persicum]|uniref:Polyketide cyclase / dehydrase and lipid transport n=1 Tax=Kibdelosporangium persicum TaxID=2698649 RepID=A0ABX2EXF2_9PSEU|nr:SRPBCC family protein [Kibdelosporangium persicum]NRN63682.1 Polyketide cyclase / dehydrase and lipid transport [Kibdelosporangium persicum]